jgi:hypothetical protein
VMESEQLRILNEFDFRRWRSSLFGRTIPSCGAWSGSCRHAVRPAIVRHRRIRTVKRA